MNRILVDHDATIRIEDNVPVGARFIVDLPTPASADQEVKTTEVSSAITTVVESRSENLPHLDLDDEGYQTHAVAMGEECLQELARSSYDLVLLDVWLPGMDGLETLTRLQEIPFASRSMVVIISGHGTIETAVRPRRSRKFISCDVQDRAFYWKCIAQSSTFSILERRR